MRFTFVVLLFGTSNLLVGCGSDGNINVVQDAEPEQIAAYEEAVRKAEEEMTGSMMTPEEMAKSMPESQGGE